VGRELRTAPASASGTEGIFCPVDIPRSLALSFVVVNELSPDDYLTQDELRRLLRVAGARSRRDQAILLVAYRHGLRASDVGRVRAGDVDVTRRKIFCRRLKGSYSALQLLGDDEVKLLRPLLARAGEHPDAPLFLSRNANPISRKRLDAIMKSYGDAAGIPKAKRHFHVLKHAFGVHLMEAGADLVLAQDLLGHKNVANTRIYARLTNAKRDQLHRAMLDTTRIVLM
jgi:site-specific recombinase XerD